MLEEFRNKIRLEGRTYKWWINVYLPDHEYHSIMAQINGYIAIKPELEKAIKKYLGE